MSWFRPLISGENGLGIWYLFSNNVMDEVVLSRWFDVFLVYGGTQSMGQHKQERGYSGGGSKTCWLLGSLKVGHFWPECGIIVWHKRG